MTRVFQPEIEYVDVRSSPDRDKPSNFYEKWIDRSSAKHCNPELIAANALRELYPGYSLVLSKDHRLCALRTLPDIKIHPSETREPKLEQLSNVVFKPTPAHGGKVAGELVDEPILGSYEVTWNNNDFVVYFTEFQNAYFSKTVYFILHDGPEQPVRDLVLAACLSSEQAHNEIWVLYDGCWSKDKALWLSVKDASWDSLIMKEERKAALQKDVYGFFKSEATYKKLSIPWKRGLILYGPPGNGKTNSIKVIMKTCTERGITPLYVKSFDALEGAESAIQKAFFKARQSAPCVMILEDLDSLINDRNRSFFLNQFDGLEANDGLLVIASTNHLNRLVPGLSSRPSRFDRKYLFDDPDCGERELYAKFWRDKLKNNDEVSFPDSLVKEIAELTEGFSFAYLKEAFMSALVQITYVEDDEWVEFPVILKSQITSLRKELGKQATCQTAPGTQPRTRGDPRVNQHLTTSRDDTISPRSLPLKTDVSPADVVSDSTPLPMEEDTCKRSTERSKSRVTEKASEAGSAVHHNASLLQGCILHAPPSAYPQVMPGSLPSTSSVRPAHMYTLRALASPSASTTGGVSANRKNPFSLDNPPLIEMDDDVHVEAL